MRVFRKGCSTGRDPEWFALIATVIAFALGGCSRGNDQAAESLVVHGTIETDDARLSFKVPGRLLERAVDEGQRIEAGMLLARLDDTELTQELAVHRAEVEVAQAALAELEAGSRPQEIAAAEATLRSANAERDRADLEFRRQESLRESAVNAEREYESARAALAVAEARVGELSERVELLRAGARPEVIAQARARLAQVQAAATLASTRVDNAQLTAPANGIVLAKHAEPGEYLGVGAPVLTVTDNTRVWLRGYVNQLDLDVLNLGQKVTVSVDAFPDRTFEGRLAFISPEAEFTPKTVQTEKERVTYVFRIRVDIENASGALKAGMAARALVPRGEPASRP